MKQVKLAKLVEHLRRGLRLVDWITAEKVKEYFPKTTISRLNRLFKQLVKQYPTGENWLVTPLSLKEPVKVEITDLQYIIAWAWERKLFKHPTYSDKIEEYILSDYHNHLNLTLTNFGLTKGLIDDNLIKEIDGYFSSSTSQQYIRKVILLVSMFCMKPINKINDEEIKDKKDLINKIHTINLNNQLALNNFRLHMGFTTKIVKQKSGIVSNWEKLSERHSHLADMFNSYKRHLSASELSKSVIKGKSIALIKLFEFLDEEGFKNCCTFKMEDFLRYTKWLRKRYDNDGTFSNVLLNTKTFFDWGVEIEEDYSFFPKILEYPTSQWKSIRSQVEKYKENSNGLSFDKKGVAEAFIQTLLEYEPLNEKEELAKNFMIIISSVPSRFDYIRTLPMNCLFHMENADEIELLGITSENPDKAGNIYGQFPILDQSAVRAIQWLQKRCIDKRFRPIESPKSKRVYVHLFQLQNYPFILSEGSIYNFIDTIRSRMPVDFKDNVVTTHRYRTHILTEITTKARNISVAQTAAGHRSKEMTKTYLRNDLSRDALLNSIKEGFEKGEYTGKFYLKLIEVLTSEDVSYDEVLHSLTTEISFNDFLKQFGRRREMGYCLSQHDCANYFKCWGCNYFLMKREEIEDAIKTLSKLLVNFKAMMNYSNDFTFDNPIAASNQKAISLIIKRICQLGLTSEQVLDMVENHLRGKDMREVLKT
jgi:hypothetical protein